MGQVQVLNLLKSSDSASTSKSKSKSLTIDNNGSLIKISFSTFSTIGFIISELNRLSRKENIIFLSTRSKNETLDYFLTFYENSIEDLPENEIYLPVLSSWVTPQISIMNYIPVKVIGKGGFSVVTLARKADSGKLFAIKTVEKSLICKKNKMKQAVVEQNILMKLNHPFIVRLDASFQTRDYLNFVLEFCPGGELFSLLQRVGVLTEEQARFYLAEIVLAIEYLHDNGVLYRDLKPENVLIDLQGHTKLTDFGLSVSNYKSNELRYTFCGSAEYMSPEMVSKTGHDFSCDAYAIGALLYEMLVGHPPFYDEDPEKMFHKITHENAVIPSSLSQDATNLIQLLLDRDPKARFAGRYISDIKDHKFFAETNWKKVYKRKTNPPYVPSLDKSNFSLEFTTIPIKKQIFSQNTIFPNPDDQFSLFGNIRNFNSIARHSLYVDEEFSVVSLPDLNTVDSYSLVEKNDDLCWVDRLDFDVRVNFPKKSINARINPVHRIGKAASKIEDMLASVNSMQNELRKKILKNRS